MDDSFGSWLAGFFDGEGHLGVVRYVGKSGSISYGCRLRIDLRDDDARLLEAIREATGLGKTYRYPDRRRVGAPMRYTQWVVFKREECLAAVSLLDRYPLRSKKARDYVIWREAVLLWQHSKRGGRYADKHQNDHIVAGMLNCKERLESVRRYSPITQQAA